MPDAAEPWWVKWACGCHDAQPSRAELPDRCPGHAAAPADPPRILWSTNRSAPTWSNAGIGAANDSAPPSPRALSRA